MKSPIRDAHAAVEKPSSMPGVVTTEAVFLFENQVAWADWLAAHHQTARAVWLRIARADLIAPRPTFWWRWQQTRCFVCR